MGEKGEIGEEKQQIKQNEKQVTNKTQQFEVCYGKESMSVRNMPPSFQPNYRCTSPTYKPKASISHLFSLN